MDIHELVLEMKVLERRVQELEDELAQARGSRMLPRRAAS